MSLHIRQAGPLDASQMADLLNEIISIGGTTAYVNPVSASKLRDWMAQDNAIWQVAENDKGEILGFQWIQDHPDLPETDCDIASFVKVGAVGLGVGSKLFEKTKVVAKQHGYRFIHAVIRADNESGLSYYQSRGFENYRRLKDVALDNGMIVDKIWKRYEL